MRTFLLSLLSMISIIGVGSFFAESKLLRLVLGLGISTLFITPLLYVNVSLIRPAQITIFMIGLLQCIRLCTSKLKKYRFRDLVYKDYLQIVFVRGSYLIGAGIFLSQFSSSQYTFESHDVLYLGWLQEIWIRDYSGALRVPTMWPEAMGVSNNIPGMIVGQVAVLEPTMNLEVAIQVKFALLLITFLCGLTIQKEFNLFKLLGMIGGLSLCSFLYSGELGTSLLLSSFWYVIILIALLEVLLKSNTIDSTTIILLVILLFAAKSQLIIIPLLILLLLYKWDRAKFNNWKVGMFTIGLTLNMIVWAIGPKSSGGDLGIPTILDVRPRQINGEWQIDFSGILRSNNLIRDWYAGSELDWIESIIDSASQVWMAVLLLIVKIYFPYYLLRKKVQINTKNLKIIDVYMVSSILSWLLIRNGGHAGHQAHAFLIAPLVTSSFILKYVHENTKKFSFYSLIGFVILPINILLGNVPLGKNQANDKREEISSVRISESTTSYGTVPISKQQVAFSIEGKRLSYKPGADYKGSQVANFTVGR